MSVVRHLCVFNNHEVVNYSQKKVEVQFK